MKFIVRDGFVVHHTKFAKIKQGNQTINQPQTDSYYAGEEVDFDESTALQHAHKLQPVCKKAHDYAESLVLPTAVVSASQMDHSTAISKLTEQVQTLVAGLANVGNGAGDGAAAA